MSVTTTPAWLALQRHQEKIFQTRLDDIILGDAERLQTFERRYEGLRLSYAFQKVTAETLSLLFNLVEQQKLEDWRARLFRGDKINKTENRAVLHTALRRTDDTPLLVDGVDVMAEIRLTQKRIAAFVDTVRSGKWTGATGKRIRHIVNIGIGGSDLGPRTAALALKPYISEVDVHFVANVDAFDLENIFKTLNAEETLFVVVSKTFTTQETLLNAQTAREWLVGKLGDAAVEKHFAAVSVNREEVEKFGIPAAQMFPMWDWVGGRFSLWSAVGLSVVLAIGNDHFNRLLAGAAAMDKHFQTAPLADNLPVLMALLGVWNRNFLDSPALVILPYCERLREMPRYLQQLEMESNGKSVTREGVPVDYQTVPALFSECGTVGQHSFHQWLHQGSTILPADFIGIGHDDYAKPKHHRALLSNLTAQIGALAFGQPQAASPHDIYLGQRPSTLIMLDKLDPYHLGLLLAMYEHKTFVQGVMWEINSFDQPGVELGKRMAKGIDKGAGTGPVPVLLDKFFKTLHSV